MIVTFRVFRLVDFQYKKVQSYLKEILEEIEER